MTTYGFLYTSAISISGFAFLLIYLSRRYIKTLPFYFIVYLAYECSSFIFELFLNAPIVQDRHIWFALVMWTSYFVAPCLWLFTREISEDTPPLWYELPRWQHVIVGIGFLLAFPTAITVFFSEALESEIDLFGLNWWHIKNTANFFCVAIGLSYIYYVSHNCVQHLRKHVNTFGAENFSLFRNIDAFEFNILRLCLIAVIVTWIVNLLRSVHCMTYGISNNFSLAITCLDIAATVVVFTLIIKKLLGDIASPSSTNTPSSPAKLNLGETVIKPEEKYARSVLDQDISARIAEKIHHALNQQKLYQHNTLTLRGLSEAIGEKHHYVSQVINQNLGSSFFELINHHRIQQAKQDLLQQPQKSITMVAEEAGFNSKSTFNSAFRKFTGMTPTQFRDRKST